MMFKGDISKFLLKSNTNEYKTPQILAWNEKLEQLRIRGI